MASAQQVTGFEHDDAWDEGWLRVDDVHEVHYQQYGKKDGKPSMYITPTTILSSSLSCHTTRKLNHLRPHV